MSMLSQVRQRLKRIPWVLASWNACRRGQLHRDYLSRREHYAHAATSQNLIYREDAVMRSVRTRLASRGYHVTPRRSGEIHTFAIVPQIAWHNHLMPDLHELGPVTLFDYTALGYRREEFLRADRAGLQRRQEMLQKALTALEAAHRKRPVDWVFCYVCGQDMSADALSRIAERWGVPTVNMCLDDKQGWAGPRVGAERSGVVDLVPHLDIGWTSARVACEWYLAEGGRPLYMPEGFNAAAFHPMDTAKDIGVSFIGDAYGFRPLVMRELRRYGIPVAVFGRGWGSRAVWGEEQVRVFNRSRINLGLGGIMYSESLTNVKTRDFEVPGTGGGVYLTTYNPDLARHFDVGREILCYHNRKEMVEMIRHYLAHPDEGEAVARAGRERCLREHRWLHRYQQLCRTLGILSG
jgi:spore maturation protein CgeB